MLNEHIEKSNLASRWNGSIAVKITAVTIWAILILSFTISIPFISSFEERSKKEHSWQQQQIEELIISLVNTGKDQDTLQSEIHKLFSSNDILYLEIKTDTAKLKFGTSNVENHALTSNILINKINHAIKFEFPSLQRAALLLRVEIGSAIVGFSFIFSIFLFWLNKKNNTHTL